MEVASCSSVHGGVAKFIGKPQQCRKMVVWGIHHEFVVCNTMVMEIKSVSCFNAALSDTVPADEPRLVKGRREILYSERIRLGKSSCSYELAYGHLASQQPWVMAAPLHRGYVRGQHLHFQ